MIGAYLEEIKHGHELVRNTLQHKQRKPLIMFKPGISNEAKLAISSHTGSLAGSIETYRTAMRQAGIVEVHEINQMFYIMMGFSWAPLPKGKRIAVVTNAGGPGIIATDEIISNGMEMARLSEETKAELRKHLPATASVNNPVDVIGDALAERYRLPLDILLRDNEVDAILLILTPQLMTQIEDTARLIINTSKLADKPIYATFIGGKYVLNGLQRLYDNKVPAFRYIRDAVRVLREMQKYSAFSGNKDMKPFLNLTKQLGKGKYQKELNKFLGKNTEALALPEELVAKMAAEVGIDMPGQLVTSKKEEALAFAKKHFPVVLKATTADIAHKTDIKALYLNLNSEEGFVAAYDELCQTINNKTGKKNPEVLIQEMIKAEEEIFIGVNRDGGSDIYQKGAEGFGHLLAFGKGGIYTEVYKDIAYSLVPASRKEIESQFDTTRVSAIVNGARGQSPLAAKKLIDTIEAVQKLVILYPEIASLDVNPILLTHKRAVAVDIKIFASR